MFREMQLGLFLVFGFLFHTVSGREERRVAAIGAVNRDTEILGKSLPDTLFKPRDHRLVFLNAQSKLVYK